MSKETSEATEKKFYNWMNGFQNPANSTFSYTPSNVEIWSWIETLLNEEREKSEQEIKLLKQKLKILDSHNFEY